MRPGQGCSKVEGKTFGSSGFENTSEPLVSQDSEEQGRSLQLDSVSARLEFKQGRMPPLRQCRNGGVTGLSRDSGSYGQQPRRGLLETTVETRE